MVGKLGMPKIVQLLLRPVASNNSYAELYGLDNLGQLYELIRNSPNNISVWQLIPCYPLSEFDDGVE